MKRSASYDETQFRLEIVEKSHSVNIVQFNTHNDDGLIVSFESFESIISKEPFSIHDPNDDLSDDLSYDSSDDSYENVPECQLPIFNHMFEPEPLEYQRCGACGKMIIIGEDGDYHPKT